MLVQFLIALRWYLPFTRLPLLAGVRQSIIARAGETQFYEETDRKEQTAP
jgi:hypothetical protein